ncbi:MAG TPA: Uma2 family endonuclease [Acidisarcina sp.]
MATKTLVPIETYEHTTYHPDQELIDGELRERNVGTFEHAKIQALLTAWFHRQRNSWSVQPLTECRVRVSPTRTRIPDLTIVGRGAFPQVLVDPPLIAIEILSPDDTPGNLFDKANDYDKMGVGNIWLVDLKPAQGRYFLGNAGTTYKSSPFPTQKFAST